MRDHTEELENERELGSLQFNLATTGLAAGFVLLIVGLYVRYLHYLGEDFPLLTNVATIVIHVGVFAVSFLAILLRGSESQWTRAGQVSLAAVLITIPAVIVYASFTFDFN